MIAVTHETTIAIKEGWYDTKAYTVHPCVSRMWLQGLGAQALVASLGVFLSAASTLY